MSKYDDTIDFTNLKRSSKACLRGCRWKRSTQSFALQMDVKIVEIQKNARQSGYSPKKTNNFSIHERGKKRNVKAHCIQDRAFYKSWSEHELYPAVESRLLECNSASQQGKGTEHSIMHFKRCLEKAIRRNKGADFYVITADYSDYFASIPHAPILDMIQFDDPRSTQTLKNYLALFKGSKGVGIGGEPSQVIAIAYPSVIDRTIICNSPAVDLGRYMDDSWIICDTLEDAKEVMSILRAKTAQYGLTLNDKITRIHHMTTDTVVWLKKRTHIDKKTNKVIMQLTRKNVRDCIRRIHKNKELLDEGKIGVDSVIASIQCWASYARRVNATKQLIRVLNEFGTTFDVPWDVMRLLLKKNCKGWTKLCRAYFRHYTR